MHLAPLFFGALGLRLEKWIVGDRPSVEPRVYYVRVFS